MNAADDTRPLDGKPANPDHPIHPLLAARWSPRAFGDAPLDDATLKRLFEAARWAPSASNTQPWGFVYARREDSARFERFVACLAAGNQPWTPRAAVLVINAAQVQAPGKDRPSPTAVYDLGQAVALLSVQATALGVAVHQMGGFDAARAAEVAGLPAGWQAVTMMALGYRGDPAQLGDVLRERELAPRVRKPQADFVFEGRLGGA